MSRRSIAIIIAFIVMAFGASAFALAPVLFPTEGEGSTQGAAASENLTGSPSADSSAAKSTASSTSSSSAPDVPTTPAGSEPATNTETAGNAQSGDDTSGTAGAGSIASAGLESPAADADAGSPPAVEQQTPAHQTTVTLSVDASTMGRGFIMAPRSVSFFEGETVFDVLSRECRNSGIPMEHAFNPLYNSAYIEGIDNLYEFDGGPQSGWMYAVNDRYPNYGCSAYVLSEGDVICWRYTCNLGKDIGGNNGMNG